MDAIIFLSVKKHISILSGKTHASLNKVHVDLCAKLHAVLELMLVVGLSTLRLNVLLNGIDLRLVLNQFFLNVVQTVVDLRLENLILFGIVSHTVVSHLLRETVLIRFQEGANRGQPNLFVVELGLQVVGLCELVVHIVFHCADFVGGLSHFLMDSTLQVFNLFEIIVDGLLLHLEPGSGGL